MTAGITGATRVYLHLAHPSAHARTPQVMNAEFALRAHNRGPASQFHDHERFLVWAG